MPKAIQIRNDLLVGTGHPLLLISGPCQIESLEHCLKIGNHIQKLLTTLKLPFNFVFKSSFDKANRTALSGKRGIGIDAGLEILRQVQIKLGCALLTDIHTPEEAQLAAEVVDIIQTPAFLCRQTDLLIAAGKTGRAVNVKKGQFLAPEDMQHVAAKISSTGNHNIMLCERGTCFGYRDLVVDMRALEIMARGGYPVIFDATHSVQSMGGNAGCSGGAREFVFPLLRAAVATGVHGIFIECHDNPSLAPSDGASMLPLEDLAAILSTISKIHQAIQ